MDDLGHAHVPEELQSESPRLGYSPVANPVDRAGQTPHYSSRRGIPEFSELVVACRHHLLLTLILGVALSAALAVLSWRAVKAPYKAESLVRVRQHQDVVFTPQTSRAEDTAFVRAQEQLVLAPQVLGAALSDKRVKSLAPHLPAHDAIQWLRNAVQVDIQTGAEVMSISVQHPSPHVAQTLCTAVTQAYLKEIDSRTTSDRQRKQQELERAARQADLRLDELWADLNRVASKVGSDNSQSLTIRDEIQLQAYREYAHQLRVAQLRGNELQSLLTDEQLRVANEERLFDEAIEEPLQNHPDVVAVREQIAKIDAQIQQVKEVAARTDSSRLKRLNEDRQLFVDDLEKTISELRPLLLEQSREQHRIKVQSTLVQLKKQIELNQAEKEFLHSRMEEIDTTIVQTDAKNGVQLEMSRHAVDRQTRLADALSQSLEEFRIESTSQPRVSLLELAPLPSHANRSRQVKAVAGAAGAGWLIAILTVGYFEWRGCRVRHSDDVQSRSTRPVFGANSAADGLWRKTMSSPPTGPQETAARLLLPNGGGTNVATLMVSSASDGEPRHLVALDLARALRVFRRRTLLIDCDTSGRKLTRQLKASQLPGLLQLSDEQVDPRQYIVPTAEKGLDFLPWGLSQETSSWMDPQVVHRVLNALRDDYDAIVVNGPALMSSAETLLLASQVDQTVLAVFQGISRWNQVAASEQFAVQAGVAVYGSILHSGKRSAALKLRFDRQGAARRPARGHVATEESLHENVMALQQEVTASTSKGTELPKTSAPNREITS